MVLQACSTTTSLSESAISMSCWMAPTCARSGSESRESFRNKEHCDTLDAGLPHA